MINLANLDSVSEHCSFIPYFVEHLLTMIHVFGGKHETHSKPEVLVKCDYKIHGETWIFKGDFIIPDSIRNNISNSTGFGEESEGMTRISEPDHGSQRKSLGLYPSPSTGSGISYGLPMHVRSLYSEHHRRKNAVISIFITSSFRLKNLELKKKIVLCYLIQKIKA